MRPSKILSLATLSLSVSFLAGCSGPMGFGTLNNNAASTSVNSGSSVLPACAVNAPQLAINGAVNSFLLTSTNGISLGYNPSGTSNGVGGSVRFSVGKMSLDLSLIGTDPFSGQVLAPAEAGSDQTNNTVNATINFQQIAAGITNYSSTPLAAVSMSALNSAVAQILAYANANAGLNWLARVQSFLPTGQVVVNAGSNSGILVGDQFSAMNVVHTDPCKADDVVANSPSTAVATLTISQVASSYSIATIKLSGFTGIQVGSELHPLNLPGNNRMLKRLVKVGDLSASPLSFADGTSIDIHAAINLQLKAALFNSFVVQ